MVDEREVNEFFERWAGLHLAALGHAANRDALDLCPLGVPARFYDAVAHPELVRAYAAANARAFPGPLALPGWVLADLYVMPGAVALLVDGTGAIAAAWCGVPTVVEGEVMGVSLFAEPAGRGAASVVKRLGLAMLRARTQRGITQWTSRSLRAHTRLGALDVLGPAPAVHGAAADSFVYRCRIGMEGGTPTETAPPHDGPALAAAAAGGVRIQVVSPGLDAAGRLVIRRG